MSCYEWERGTIRIPAGQYSAFRKKVLAAWNKRQKYLLKVAKEVHARLKKAGYRKRNFDFGNHFRENFEQLISLTRENSFLHADNEDDRWIISRLLFDDDKKPHLPKQKDLKLVPISKQTSIHFDDASISFNDENKTVTWSVSENNHAVERAHEHPMAGVLFEALENVEWKRKSGGTIVKNDEYHRESYEEDGGGNYATHRYGPLGGEKTGRKRHAPPIGGYGYQPMGLSFSITHTTRRF
ncbi:hypothetical protein CMI47_10260 [Candidatus Pacearchaeota archaeon]|nr:hypothetical protein [Candidatus Pacearchaeota archaeon]|tara:strand:- start:14806 stop:15525 length:720 start_codon:yes stop_codon:yes gene_type:complete